MFQSRRIPFLGFLTGTGAPNCPRRQKFWQIPLTGVWKHTFKKQSAVIQRNKEE
jgi:hypothetical protein